MIKVVKHGKMYQKPTQEHVYECQRCKCKFWASTDDMTYTIVGHGMMDYVGHCPECGNAIYDMLDRAQ